MGAHYLVGFIREMGGLTDRRERFKGASVKWADLRIEGIDSRGSSVKWVFLRMAGII